MTEKRKPFEPIKITLRCECAASHASNNNGCVYPPEVIDSMVKQVKSKIEIGHLFGRLGVFESVKVQLHDACIRVTDARKEDDGKISVDCEVLNTEKGVLLAGMIESLGKNVFQQSYEVAPCGRGSTKHVQGYREVGNDYRLASFDIVPKLKAVAPSVVREQLRNEERSEADG